MSEDLSWRRNMEAVPTVAQLSHFVASRGGGVERRSLRLVHQADGRCRGIHPLVEKIDPRTRSHVAVLADGTFGPWEERLYSFANDVRIGPHPHLVDRIYLVAEVHSGLWTPAFVWHPCRVCWGVFP